MMMGLSKSMSGPLRDDEKGGTTLVEIVLAVAILAFAMMPIFGLMSFSNSSSRMQKVEGVAANMAKEEMNRWMFAMKPENFTNDGQVDQREENIEGNFYRVTVRAYRHPQTTLVRYPRFKWHDFRTSCAGGREGNSLTGSTFVEAVSNKSFEDVTHDSTAPLPAGETRKTFRLVDVALEVQWRLPTGSYNNQNRLVLISRRGWM